MWIDSASEFQLYKNKNFNWEISFRPEGFIPVDFKLQDRRTRRITASHSRDIAAASG